ncbi:hypothetical protein [Pseudarthrobacter scleromae]|uniref:hypothetical protein n=1 Tax=Pseudarthrobacter scleromae TaxID=158897 RepID=UPI003D055212
MASWILVTASRPFTWMKTLILAGMYAGLALLFTVPPAKEFFRLDWPPPDLLAVSVTVAVGGSLIIEAIRYFQRRLAGRSAD